MISKELLEDLDSYIHTYDDEDEEYSEMGEDPSIYTYGPFVGDTPFSTFAKIVGGMRRPKRLVVLGSSIGWKCFYWNSIYPDIPAVGYDIHEVRHDYACYLGEKYEVENVSFVCGDMSECDFREGDLVWENNICMNHDEIERLNYMLLSSFEDIQIVSYIAILGYLCDDDKKITVASKDGSIKRIPYRRERGNIFSSTDDESSWMNEWSIESNFWII